MRSEYQSIPLDRKLEIIGQRRAQVEEQLFLQDMNLTETEAVASLGHDKEIQAKINEQVEALAMDWDVLNARLGALQAMTEELMVQQPASLMSDQTPVAPSE